LRLILGFMSLQVNESPGIVSSPVLSLQNENVRFVQSLLSWMAEGGPMEPERITLSQRERDRLKVLHEVKQNRYWLYGGFRRNSAIELTVT